jgi:hypothetical protein
MVGNLSLEVNGDPARIAIPRALSFLQTFVIPTEAPHSRRGICCSLAFRIAPEGFLFHPRLLASLALGSTDTLACPERSRRVCALGGRLTRLTVVIPT